LPIGNGQAPGTTTGRGATGAAAGLRAAAFPLAGLARAGLFFALRRAARRATGLRLAGFFFPAALFFAFAI